MILQCDENKCVKICTLLLLMSGCDEKPTRDLSHFRKLPQNGGIVTYDGIIIAGG